MNAPEAGTAARSTDTLASHWPVPQPRGVAVPGGVPLPVQQIVPVSVPVDGGAAYHLVGAPGVALGSAHKAAVHLVWAMLGGREGLLDRRLRGEQALTYTLAAFSREFAEGGYGLCMAGCAAAVLDAVADGIAAEMAVVARGEFAPALLASARERLLIAHLGALENARGITERLCAYEIAGVGAPALARYPGDLTAVDADKVVAAARLVVGAAD